MCNKNGNNQLTHAIPSYRYNGGYDRVTKCLKCDSIALRHDAHPVEPCIVCGGKVIDYGAAKWVPPVYVREWLIFKRRIKRGYWDFAEKG